MFWLFLGTSLLIQAENPKKYAIQNTFLRFIAIAAFLYFCLVSVFTTAQLLAIIPHHTKHMTTHEKMKRLLGKLPRILLVKFLKYVYCKLYTVQISCSWPWPFLTDFLKHFFWAAYYLAIWPKIHRVQAIYHLNLCAESERQKKCFMRVSVH